MIHRTGAVSADATALGCFFGGLKTNDLCAPLLFPSLRGKAVLCVARLEGACYIMTTRQKLHGHQIAPENSPNRWIIVFI